jgi:hypothetical protein
MTTLRRALDGCGENVSFKGLPIYYERENGMEFSILGSQRNKMAWIEDNLKKEYQDDSTKHDVEHHLLVDWELYENGWLVKANHNNMGYKDSRLMYYKCQIGNSKSPQELHYFN